MADINFSSITPFAHAYCGKGGENFLATTTSAITEEAHQNYPVRELSEIVFQNRFRDSMPEVIVLGCGTGKLEARILRQILILQKEQGIVTENVFLTAVDINRDYFQSAKKTIEQGFSELSTISFNPVLGDFTSPICWDNIRKTYVSAPLILMFGTTLGNLSEKGGEFLECISSSPIDTILVIDFQLTYTSSKRIEEIVAMDPAVKGLVHHEEYQQWFRGMLTSRGMDPDMDLEIAVVPISATGEQGCLPGGYRLEITTTDNQVLFSFQRFDLMDLQEVFKSRSWTILDSVIFNGKRTAALVLKKHP